VRPDQVTLRSHGPKSTSAGQGVISEKRCAVKPPTRLAVQLLTLPVVVGVISAPLFEHKDVPEALAFKSTGVEAAQTLFALTLPRTTPVPVQFGLAKHPVRRFAQVPGDRAESLRRFAYRGETCTWYRFRRKSVPGTREGPPSFTYDARDRLTQITDPLNGQTKYFYDPVGNLDHINQCAGDQHRDVYVRYGESTNQPFVTKFVPARVAFGPSNVRQNISGEWRTNRDDWAP